MASARYSPYDVLHAHVRWPVSVVKCFLHLHVARIMRIVRAEFPTFFTSNTLFRSFMSKAFDAPIDSPLMEYLFVFRGDFRLRRVPACTGMGASWVIRESCRR